MEESIKQIHKKIKELFPDAVSVRISVNSEDIQVEPQYRANLVGYSMRTITGKWVGKQKDQL